MKIKGPEVFEATNEDQTPLTPFTLYQLNPRGISLFS